MKVGGHVSGEGATHSMSVSLCYRILQQISERFYNESERRSGGVHGEMCVLYAKLCECVCLCVGKRERERERVEWRREQGVG